MNKPLVCNINVADWKLMFSGYDSKKELLREVLCSLGNGYMGLRTAQLDAKADDTHYPGLYIAGLYNRLPTKFEEKIIFNEDMVNCPNPVGIRFKVTSGRYVSVNEKTVSEYAQEIDFRTGITHQTFVITDATGKKTRVETERFVHFKEEHVIGIKYMLTPLNHSEKITVESSIDGSVENTGVKRYRGLESKHWTNIEPVVEREDRIGLSATTNQSKVCVGIASSFRLTTDSVESVSKKKAEEESVRHAISFPSKKGGTYAFEKMIAVHTSKDSDAFTNPLNASIGLVEALPNYLVMKKTHQEAWEDIWRLFDVHIEGHGFSQLIVRFNTFHLLQTASPNNIRADVGFPARGLNGEAYHGHIFWDEVFALPVYDYNYPEITRALLGYRFRRLKQARKAAAKHGYDGAMFPWQSASDGKETTQEIHLNPLSGRWNPDHSMHQRHVSFAIAFNAYKYWRATDDDLFWNKKGAELFLSIAQFAASLPEYDSKTDRYHTRGLMGPDEFQETMTYDGEKEIGLRDNAYSNVMIVWILNKALKYMRECSVDRLENMLRICGIKKHELHRWKDIVKKMHVGMNEDGIIEQFDGYFGLKELNWDAYRKKYGNIRRMDRILRSEGKSTDDYKISKQADVLMLYYLLDLDEMEEIFRNLGYAYDSTVFKKNYEYYVARTSHGSTLSKIVHCYLALGLGKIDEAWNWYTDVLQSDVCDTQGGTTIEGIHTGVMGASIRMVAYGFCGIEFLRGHMEVEPHVPKQWDSVTLRLLYKGIWYLFHISHDTISITRESSSESDTKPARPIIAAGKKFKLKPGQRKVIRMK